MKHIGSYFEYEKERNEDLLRAYRLCEVRHLCKQSIYAMTVQMPARRFWVSEERATVVISQMLRGKPLRRMRPNKRKMFAEIYRRVLLLMTEKPDEPIAHLVFEVVNSPAPKFYLTPSSAKIIICKIKRKWYEERKKKLRYMTM